MVVPPFLHGMIPSTTHSNKLWTSFQVFCFQHHDRKRPQLLTLRWFFTRPAKRLIGSLLNDLLIYSTHVGKACERDRRRSQCDAEEALNFAGGPSFGQPRAH